MKKLNSLLTLIAMTLIFATPSSAEICEQHEFGSSFMQYYVYADGRTWTFDAENDLAVRYMEVKSVLGSYGGTFYIEIKINETVMAEWDHYVNNPYFSSYKHTEKVTFDLQPGDTITYRIYGGTMGSSAGAITGTNYIKLCESDPSTTTTTTGENTCPSTKIYGKYSEETALLRYFRDAVLSQTAEGREIIRLYYQWSPVIMKIMEEDEEFKEEVKVIIDEAMMLIGEEE